MGSTRNYNCSKELPKHKQKRSGNKLEKADFDFIKKYNLEFCCKKHLN